MFEAFGCYCEMTFSKSCFEICRDLHGFTVFLMGCTMDLLGFGVVLLRFNHGAFTIQICFTGGYHVLTMVLPGFYHGFTCKIIVNCSKTKVNQSKTRVKLVKTMVNPIKSMANLSKTQSKVNPDISSKAEFVERHSTVALCCFKRHQISAQACAKLTRQNIQGCVVFVNSLFCSIFSCFS